MAQYFSGFGICRPLSQENCGRDHGENHAVFDLLPVLFPEYSVAD